jgi:dihydrofolate synthase/folylpolyglutamate synthase
MDFYDQNKYQDSLDYIYSFVDFSRTHQENLSPENFDLSRMVDFMELLGFPQDRFPSIHIAGSKGKGSVSAFCASVLQDAGYKVGLYTSPHLKDFEERIQINQVPIPRPTLVDYVEEIKEVVASVPELTTFEIMTGLGFLYFSRQNVDIAVIEVGLGGRLDATNIITPLLSVITALYLDHTSILGDTIEEIAMEKGGIIKPGIPVVCAPQSEIALGVIKGIAAGNNAPFIDVQKEYPFSITSRSLAGQSFRLESTVGKGRNDVEFSIPLLGSYQVENAVTAIASVDIVREQGFPVREETLHQGLANTKWPARFEVVRQEPPVIMDSAHNPASMLKLIETVDDFFPDHKMILVFGISEDKQLSGMYQAILPRTSYLICTQADHPRAMDPSKLAEEAGNFSGIKEVIPVVGDALCRAVQLADENTLVLVTGSIFVAASARIAWFEGRGDFDSAC